MREILFRGKRVDNGEWIDGNYEWYHNPPKHIISNPYTGETKEVISETVGQYTGLTDKNGTKIFEGDIIEVDRIYDTLQPQPRRFTVEWEESSRFLPSTVYRDGGDYFIDTDYCKVIGNIYDNPELLEVNK